MKEEYSQVPFADNLKRKLKRIGRKKLETVLLNCKKCDEQTPHTYSGYHGVHWSPVYVYKCIECGLTQHSKKKYEMKKE